MEALLKKWEEDCLPSLWVLMVVHVGAIKSPYKHLYARKSQLSSHAKNVHWVNGKFQGRRQARTKVIMLSTVESISFFNCSLFQIYLTWDVCETFTKWWKRDLCVDWIKKGALIELVMGSYPKRKIYCFIVDSWSCSQIYCCKFAPSKIWW